MTNEPMHPLGRETESQASSLSRLVEVVEKEDWDSIPDLLRDPELIKTGQAWRALLAADRRQSDEEGKQAFLNNRHDPELLTDVVFDNNALLQAMFDSERGPDNRKAFRRIVGNAAAHEKQLADKDALITEKDTEIAELKRKLAETESTGQSEMTGSPSTEVEQPRKPTQTWGKLSNGTEATRLSTRAGGLKASEDEIAAEQNAFDTQGPLPEPERRPAMPNQVPYDVQRVEGGHELYEPVGPHDSAETQKFDEALQKVEDAFGERADTEALTTPEMPDPNRSVLDPKNDDPTPDQAHRAQAPESAVAAPIQHALPPATLEGTRATEMKQYNEVVNEYLAKSDESGNHLDNDVDKLILGVLVDRNPNSDEPISLGLHHGEIRALARKALNEQKGEDSLEYIAQMDTILNNAVKEAEAAKQSQGSVADSTETNGNNNGADVAAPSPEAREAAVPLAIVEGSVSLQKVKRGAKDVSAEVQLSGYDVTAPQYTARLESDDGDRVAFETVNIVKTQANAITLKLNKCEVPKNFGPDAHSVKIMIEDGNREVETGPIILVQ